MRIFLAFLLLFIANALFASLEDDFTRDRIYSLREMYPETVDTSVRFTITEPKKVPRKKSDDWSTDAMSSGSYSLRRKLRQSAKDQSKNGGIDYRFLPSIHRLNHLSSKTKP